MLAVMGPLLVLGAARLAAIGNLTPAGVTLSAVQRTGRRWRLSARGSTAEQGAALLGAGCRHDMDDLETYIAEVRSRGPGSTTHGTARPLPHG